MKAVNKKVKIDITDRTFTYGVRIIDIANKLPNTPAGRRIGGQIVGSGTSIGANVREAQSAISKKDFINIICIALKEARETEYWLKIIADSKLLPTALLRWHITEIDEIIKILVTIMKNTKKNYGLHS